MKADGPAPIKDFAAALAAGSQFIIPSLHLRKHASRKLSVTLRCALRVGMEPCCQPGMKGIIKAHASGCIKHLRLNVKGCAAAQLSHTVWGRRGQCQGCAAGVYVHVLCSGVPWCLVG